ncbi:MAG TPA: DUF4846 domain-containing protein [Puia sp.]
MRWNLRSLLPKGSIIIFFFCCSCDQRAQAPAKNPYLFVGAIPAPADYRRIAAGRNSFGAWLRQISLKKDRTVYLFDGSPKRNQEAQFAVLDISVGHKDLQQCADAVMRLRAEFLYAQKDFADIDFYTAGRTRLNFREWAGGRRVRLSGDRLVQYALQPAASRSGPEATRSVCDDRACFSAYLETVFSYCGTLSLEKQLVPVSSFDDMLIGDVLIRGGSPGHAMLVVDMAVDSMGHKVYLLAQSYMPAQDIHIVNNPVDGTLSPWYRVDKKEAAIETPEWTFYTHQLRAWPGPGS